MADLLQRFSGNPFATPVGQRIEQATDPSVTNEDWGLYMEICDFINDTEDGPRDAVRAIKRRLQQTAGKNFHGFKLTLSVLETCVKNCGKRFHILVTNKDFVQDLVKLIGPKNEPPPEIQEKVLSLIQSWAEAFHGQPEMQGVSQVYNELRNKGIEFPKSSNEPKVPIYTPQRTSPAYKSSEASSPPIMGSSPPSHPATSSSSSYPIHLSPEQLNKLKTELEIVQRNMKVLSEMLTEMKPGQEHRDDWELLIQLYNTCHSMQRRIMELIEKIANEEVTNELLRINDDLNNLFMRFDRYQKKRERDPNTEQQPQSGDINLIPSTSTTAVSAPSSVKKPTNIPSLIDFTDEPDTVPDVTAKMKELDIKQPQQQQQPAPDDKEFDMFAQSRSTSGPGLAGVPPPKPELRPKDPAPPLTEQEQEKEMEEIERWLNTKPGEPSMSFEAFLERRANALNKQPMKKPDQDSSLI